MGHITLLVKAGLCITAIVTGLACTPSTGGGEIEHSNVAFDVSPTDNVIVFSSAAGRLYLLDLRQQRLQPLTSTHAIEQTPSFSPTGAAIVYVSREKGAAASAIFYRTLDGRLVRQLTKAEEVSDYGPSFSRDGSQIVFARAYRHRPYSLGGWTWDRWDVCVMNADGSGLRRITQQQYYSLDAPRFLPDGKSVLYSALSAGTVGELPSTMFEVSATTGQVRRFFSQEVPKAGQYVAWAAEPNVSRNGKRIAFISDRLGPFNYDVFTMARDGTESQPLQVCRVSRYNKAPAFMPSGNSILFLAGTESNNSSRPIFSLWEVNVDGKKARRIASSELFTNPDKWKAETQSDP